MRSKLYLISSILAFVAVKTIFLLTKVKVPIWDEAVYIAIGKYMYSFGTSGLWEMIRPLCLSGILGFFWKIGFDPIIAGEILANLFSIGLIIVVYLLAKKISGERFAFLASLFLALNPIFFLYSSYILTEIPCALFLTLAMIYYYKRKYMLAGLFSGIAFMFKFPSGLVLVAFLLLFLFRRKFKELLKYLVSFVLVSLPLLIFNYFVYRHYTSNAFDAIFRPFILGSEHQFNQAFGVAGFWNNAFYYLKLIFGQSPYLLFALVALYAFIFRRGIRNKSSVLWLYFAVFFVYFSSIVIKQDRFFILFLPVVCILAADGVIRLWTLKLKKKWLLKVLIVILIIVLIIPSLYLDRSYYDWRFDEKPDIVAEYYSHFDDEDIVLTSDPVPAAYADSLFIPYYFMVSDDITAYNEWEQELKANKLIYMGGAFYCNEGDIECENKKDALFENLNRTHSLEFKFNNSWEEYYIFNTSQV